METYLLFLLVATVTILSPGPGVLLTLTNSIKYGTTGAIGGIFGIAFGTFIVASISATGVSVILATSALAFNIMKYIGALYLIYLGIKLWNSEITQIDITKKCTRNIKKQFLEGLIIQITNPKAIFFFISIFPQFINFTSGYIGQFLLLVITFSMLNLIIHFMYSYIAKNARQWLSSKRGGKIVNKAGGGTFMLFGIGLASANR